MILASILSHRTACLWYLIVFGVIMAIGGLFNRRNGVNPQAPTK